MFPYRMGPGAGPVYSPGPFGPTNQVAGASAAPGWIGDAWRWVKRNAGRAVDIITDIPNRLDDAEKRAADVIYGGSGEIGQAAQQNVAEYYARNFRELVFSPIGIVLLVVTLIIALRK